MKRITISLLIGAAFFLLALGFTRFFENGTRNIRSGESSFNGELKISVGHITDPINLIKTTIGQIRARNSYEISSTEQIDKNTFLISAKDIYDTVTFRKLLTGSAGIEFPEVFTVTEIQNSIVSTEEELSKRRKKYLESLKPDTNLLSAQIELTDLARKNGYGKLVELISFSQPFQKPNGMLFYPAGLGFIKKNDTAYLNEIFRDKEIMMNFPETLKFAYGSYDKTIPGNDSLLALYALKINDQRFNANPTGDQIIDAELDFETESRFPVIMFAFNARGSEAWYRMTERNIGRPVAILINDFVLTAPVVESAIEGGKARIAGDFTIAEAVYIRTIMKFGKLSLPVRIIEQKYSTAKKSKKTPWILAGIFVFISVLSYGISFLVKPASKP